MSIIPGLSLCPVDEEDKGQGIEVESFDGISVIPQSHRKGRLFMLSDFVKLGKISEGKLGTIYKCKDKNDRIYALKKFTVEGVDGIPSCIVREVSLSRSLKHPNIVHSPGQLAGKKIETHYLLLDYYVMSLEDLIAKNVSSIYDSDVIKYMMRQLLQGLEYIHERCIIHRDINCNNIVFAPDGTLKITGFRSARFLSRGNMAVEENSELIYRAPELLFKSRRYDEPVDMWSTGCVLARLLLKKPLFTGSTALQVLESIIQVLGRPSEGIWPGFNKIVDGKEEFVNLQKMECFAVINDILAKLSPRSQEFVQDILLYYPDARLTASSSLKNSYFKEAPRECPVETFVKILKNAVSTDVPMDTGED